MNDQSGLVSRLYAFWVDLVQNDPMTATGVIAALVAFASTPLAFAVLGRLDWFKARRGRVLQKPEFFSVVAAISSSCARTIPLRRRMRAASPSSTFAAAA